jgi:hypothetical protein
MPENLFLLLPLIGGFLFAKNWNKTKWYAARWEKERLLLNSALWGLMFFFFAYLMIKGQDLIPCQKYLSCLPRWPMDMGEFKYLGPSLLALIIGSQAWRLGNLIWKQQEEKIIQTEGTLVDIMANESIKKRKSVLLTLKSGKVYAGIITSTPSPGHSRPMLRILPTTSGYRDRKTHRVVFTTNYSQALEQISHDCGQLANDFLYHESKILQLEHASVAGPDEAKRHQIDDLKLRTDDLYTNYQSLSSVIEDFGILIPVDEITSMTFYHASIHTKYFASLEKKSSAKK